MATRPVEPPARSSIERQLNIGLMVVQVIAALIAVYAVGYVALGWDGDGERSRWDSLLVAFVFLVLPGTVVFFTARSARERLSVRAASTRLFGVLTGIFAIMAGLPILATVFGMLMVVAGLFVLTAAFLLKKELAR